MRPVRAELLPAAPGGRFATPWIPVRGGSRDLLGCGMATRKEVVITGVDIPFFAAVWLILKWSLAAIPAMMLLWMVGATFAATVGLALQALIASFQ